ncbi:hypothetical protein [Paraburkholderia sp. GAS334]|uniref:hypothetical protein n=1 Tax=Paraburkholderia sp. GAS334 TaxID=3035131 RepID=UPI003D21DBC5
MTTSNIETGGWPVNDITGLARRLPELDPTAYLDGQASEAYESALTKWPVLAKLMGLTTGKAEPAE